MMNGAYAGPVTDGNTVVIVRKLPSSRSCARAGSSPDRIAAPSTSGRAPSARRVITEGEAGTRFGYGKNQSHAIYEKEAADRANQGCIHNANCDRELQIAQNSVRQARQSSTAQTGE